MLNLPSRFDFPDGLDAVSFLNKYWQQSPLLLGQAFPDFETPLSPDELAGLSLEPGTSPRLITKDKTGMFRLEYGPFDEDRFASLNSNDWSLLVTDVEKHLPEIRSLLLAFSFLPTWRIDDVMVSYAPDNASVGAHVDEYDVFLLQASGQRRWLIEDRPRQHEQSTQGDLRLVEDFSPDQEMLLEAGDMLYLPPGVAHHGIAVGDDCTTWSIGFRAPAIDELVANLSELIAARLGQTVASKSALTSARYRDPPLSPATVGEIDDDAISNFEQLWRQATTLSHKEFSMLIGSMLTQNGNVKDEFENRDERRSNDSVKLDRQAFADLAWCGVSESVTLFANGVAYACSKSLAIRLCGMQSPTLDLSLLDVDEKDLMLIKQLVTEGVLVGSD